MPSNDLFQPGAVFNGYSIEDLREPIDGPIQCYLARDTRADHPVMLHCIDCLPAENTPERIERFNAMVARLRALDVPYVAKLYDGGVVDRIYWAATEHEFGALTLESILGNSDEQLKIPLCFILVSELAAALREAHRAGIRHLRLHPGRVCLTRNPPGIDKVLEFGLADLFSLSPAIMRLDPLYAAPEQLRDNGYTPDERADIYALGMVFYAMLAWARPFADASGRLPSKSKLLLLAMTQTPSLIGERIKPFPDFLDVFAQSVIAKARSDRPTSAKAFSEQLNDIAGRWSVWCDAMEDLGNLAPAKKEALKAALQGPAPEGTELHVLLARLLGTTLLGPRVQKSKKPQSGDRPSAALRAGVEGYRVEDEEGTEQGTPEPAWLASLPVEPEPLSGDSVEPPALPAPPAAPASLSQGTNEPPALPEPPDGAPPEPVTLPSGKVATHGLRAARHARSARSKRAALGVGALFACSLGALALVRSSADLPTVARSAALYAIRAPELPAAPTLVELRLRAPEPSVALVAPSAPSATQRRASPLPARPVTSASASAAPEPPTRGPDASLAEEKDEDPCKTFYCLPERM